MDFLPPLQILWDYLGMHQTPEKADVIVGFGNFNDNIARRAAELYLQGYAPKILFTREMLERLGLKHDRILGVHQPFMERRICAAMGVYWPEQSFRVTSPQVTIPEYLREAERQGMTREGSISVIVGDFQRMDLYARLGYQLPQEIPEQAWEAFRQLVDMGYDKQLAK